MIAVDRRIGQPLHRQIYDSFRMAIVERRLRPGQRIPSTRVLATEIGVSRFPVLNAYAQLLAEGYLESRVGAGTVVSSSLPEQLTSSHASEIRKPAVAGGARRASRRYLANRCALLPHHESFPWFIHTGPFRVGQIAFDHFPLQTWAAITARHCRSLNRAAVHYGDLMGSSALRHAIANYLRTARSVRCEAEQVMIVNGSQQALEIAARVLLNPGDAVWMEDPNYRLARDVFHLSECRLVPVPVDEQGLNVADGIRRCRRARAAFVTPSHQFPLGVTMSASRRLQLLDWAQKVGSWIIEDDYDSEYRYESLPIASLQGLDTNARVIYVGTFSKVLFPALRLGYLVVPPDLMQRFAIMRRVMDLGAPTLAQEVLAEFIEEGHFARHIRRMRVHYCELRQVLVAQIREHLSDKLEIVGDEAGMHVTVLLKTSHKDEDLAQLAVQHNLSLWPVSRSYFAQPRQGFILGFGGLATREIPDAVRRLRRLLSSR